MTIRKPRRKRAEDLSLVRTQNQNDRVNAERFVIQHRYRILHCHELGWLFWDGCRWKPGAKSQAMELAKETGKALLKEAQGSPDCKDAMVFARTSNNRSGLENMLALAATDKDISVAVADLDKNQWLLNCPNGTVDLNTGEIRKHDPKDLITQLCPTEFNPLAVAPRFEAFIASLFDSPEAVEFLQRWFGYCLTGNTDEHQMTFLIGDGANGKSTLLKTIQAVFGEDYAMQSTQEFLSANQKDSHPTTKMDPFRKRLVVCSELERNERLAEAFVKQATGGEYLRGRGINQNSWQYSQTHKFCIETNNMPKVSADPALWRRFIIIEFQKRFWSSDKGEKGPRNREQDTNLSNKLKKEASGILAWLIRGSLQHQDFGGLRVPQCILEATERYRSKSDHFTEFFLECCERCPSESVKSSDVYEAFGLFCERHKYLNDLSHKHIAQRLMTVGFEKFKSNGIRYRGLKLRPQTLPLKVRRKTTKKHRK